MSVLLYWLKASRPRFWLYLLGPALLGVAAGIQYYVGWTDGGLWAMIDMTTASLLLLLILLWLTFPLNVFIYGINDLFDVATDMRNPKKHKQEVLLGVARRQQMKLVVVVIGIISIAIGIALPAPARIAWYLFLFLGITYSAPPIRWKKRLFIDAYSNVLYVLPAWVTFGLLTSTWLSSWWLLVGLLWTAGMHTFSAIPDIDVDRQAHIVTTAVRLGYERALVFVGMNWLLALVVGWFLVGQASLLLLIYPVLVVIVYLHWQPADRVYWWFPWINAGVGFISFWFILLAA